MDSLPPAGPARAARPFRWRAPAPTLTPALAPAIALALPLLLVMAGDAPALTVFTPGTPAKASEVNANFAELSDRIGVVEPYTARVVDLEQLPPRVTELELLPARVAQLETLPGRVDALGTLPPRVADLETFMPRIEQLETLPARVLELETLPGRMDALETLPRRVDALEVLPRRVDTLEMLPGRVDALETLPRRVDALEALPRRVDALELLPGRVDALETLPRRVDALEALPDRVLKLEAIPPRLDALELLPPRLRQLESMQAAETLNVNCVADRSALQDILANGAGPGDRLVVAGECSGPVRIAQRGLSLRSGSPDARIVGTSDAPALDIAAADVAIDGITVRAAGGAGTIGIRIRHGDAVLDDVAVNNAETDILVTIGGAALLRDSDDVDTVTATDGGTLLLGDDNGTLSLAIRRGAGATVLPHGDTTMLSGLEVTEDARFSAMAEVAIDGRLVLSRNATAAFEAGLDLAYRNGAAPDEPGIAAERNASLTIVGGTVDASIHVSGGSDVTATNVDFTDSTGRDRGGLLTIDAASTLTMIEGKAGAITTTAGSATLIDGVTLEGAANGIALRVIGGHATTRGDTSLGQDAVIEDNGTLSMEETTLSGDLVARRNSSIRIGDDVDVRATRANNGSCPISPRAGIRLDMGSMLSLDTAATDLSGFLEVSRFSAFDPGTITRLPDIDAEHETTDQLPSIGGISLCSSG
jgi:hypothetical protein